MLSNIPSFGAGFVVGFGSGFFTREILANTKRLRPAVKSVIKAGLQVFDNSRERLAYVSESLDDLLAEVRAETEQKALQRKSDDATKDTTKRANTGKKQTTVSRSSTVEHNAETATVHGS